MPLRPQARQRVLIVDDDPWVRETRTFLLAEAGYQTLTASDGVEALDTLLVSDERLVVVLDLLMRQMTGFEVLERVAHDTHLATWHGYLVCSAKADSAEHIGPQFAALLQRLNIPYLKRPFDIDTLVQVVREVAGRLLQANKATDEGAVQDTQDVPHSA